MNARNAFAEQPGVTQLAEIQARSNTRNIRPLEKPSSFTPADKSLIRKVHGYMQAQQLLVVLNERLVADRPGAMLHTMEQLYAEIGTADPMPSGSHDWSSLRKLVAKARRDGVLDAVTRQLIDDFAVVFSLTSAQVLRLHDVLLRSREAE